jgi:hypothetical protein
LATGQYQAENKLKMKVQGYYKVVYQFDGKSISVIEIQTN